MTEAEVLFVIGLAALAVWQRSMFLGFAAMFGAVMAAPRWLDEGGWYCAAPALLLGVALLIRTVWLAMSRRIFP